jgi:hypothetical protein
VRKLRRTRNLIPAWDMPSDPVKAVFWFIHWSLRVLVRFFWLLILAGVIYESLINGAVGGVVTLLVGLGVWVGLVVALLIFNAAMGVTRTVEEIGRMQQQGFVRGRPFSPSASARPDIDASKIVEGSVTDLEEERRKRRRE